MKMRVFFEEMSHESVIKFKDDFEKMFKTIENLGAQLQNEKLDTVTIKKRCDFLSHVEDCELEMEKLTFEYEMADDCVANVKTFMDFLLEIDMQFEYELYR